MTALAAALTWYYDCVPQSEAETDAAAILTRLPPDWCGHAEIAKLAHQRAEQNADLRAEADRAWAIVDGQEAEIDRLQAQIARQAAASPELAAAFAAVRGLTDVAP